MNWSDGIAFLKLYAVWLLASALVWPVFLRCGFGRIAGWMAARATGVGLLTLVVFHVARWGRLSLSSAVALTAGLIAVIVLVTLPKPRTRRRLTLSFTRRRAWGMLLKGEGLLLGCALAVALLFGFHYGSGAFGERPLDLGLVNGLMQTPAFPPEHFWAAGSRLHYYYYGSLVAAAAGQAARLPGAGTYFHYLVLIWVQTAAGAWVAGRLMGARGRAAFLAPVCLILLGTAAPLYHWIQSGLEPWASGALMRSVRVIPGTVNENPAAAFWISELHSYVLALPYVCVLIPLLFTAVRNRSVPAAATGAAVAAVIFMTDPWEAPILAVAVVLGSAVIAAGDPRRRLFAFAALPAAAAAALLLSTPLLAGFRGYPIRGKLLEQSTTEWGHLAALFGPVAGALVLAWAAGDPRLRRLRRAGWVAGTLVAAGLFSIVLCELVYLDTRFLPPAERQNTVMRLHWIGYVLLALAVSPAAASLNNPGPILWRRTVPLTALVLLLAGFALLQLVPVLGLHVQRRTPLRWSDDMRQGLDPRQSGLIAVAEYLQRVTSPGTVLAESGGIPYSGYGLVSVLSGRPAVFGEADKVTQHGVPDAEVSARHRDLGEIYAATPAGVEALQRYGVRYIVVGPAERRAFPQLNEPELLLRYPVAFRSKRVTLLRVPASGE